MKEEIKDLWVKALRSGNYKQGQGFLRSKVSDDYRYCCLGVLCDLAVNEGVVSVLPEGVNGGSAYAAYGEEHDICHLPKEVMAWSGIRGPLGQTPYNSLARLNDGLKYNFNQIADFIDENWKVL